MDRDEILMAHRELYAVYHNHKEQIAYAASVLYLAGAAVLMFMDIESFAQERSLKLIFAAIVFAAAFVFVAWQLRQRQLAADVVEACERLLARIAAGEISTGPTDARTYHGLHLPHFLVDELVIVAESRKPLCGPLVPELITYLTMLAAALLVAIRITG